MPEKTGSRKFYDLAETHIPEAILRAEDPCPEETAHIQWRILRRIGAVGLLPNRRSDAFLGIPMTTEQRNLAFEALEREDGVKRTKKLMQAIEAAVRSFARFHQCTPSMEEAYHG